MDAVVLAGSVGMAVWNVGNRRWGWAGAWVAMAVLMVVSLLEANR